jgi:hypothetical protein
MAKRPQEDHKTGCAGERKRVSFGTPPDSAGHLHPDPRMQLDLKDMALPGERPTRVPPFVALQGAFAKDQLPPHKSVWLTQHEDGTITRNRT